MGPSKSVLVILAASFLFALAYPKQVDMYDESEVSYENCDDTPKSEPPSNETSGFKKAWSSVKTSVGKFVDKIVPDPVQKLFRGRSTDLKEEEEEINEYPSEDERKKEHGSLDFFGRDFVRGVERTWTKVQEKIGLMSSNTTTGLDCNTTFFSGVLDKFKEKVQAIYPGTKWCGDGNKSRSYDDLGKHSEADACCREHDYCPDNIPAGETKYDLVNTGLFTRSHCGCDRKFYDCLKTANTSVARKIGFTYFTVLGPQCFIQDYPVVGCSQTRRGKCLEYEQERSGEKRFQWFDSPVF